MSDQEDRDSRAAQQRARRTARRKCGLHGIQAKEMMQWGEASIPVCATCIRAFEAIRRGCAFDEVPPGRVRPEKRIPPPQVPDAVRHDSQEPLTLHGIVTDLWDWLWGR